MCKKILARKDAQEQNYTARIMNVLKLSELAFTIIFPTFTQHLHSIKLLSNIY